MRLVYLLVNTKHGKVKLVSTRLSKLEEVKELHETYGRFDIIVKVEAEDDEAFKQFMQNKISVIDGISKTETMIVSDSKDQAKEAEEFEEGHEEAAESL